MPELLATLEAVRERSANEHKFLAALQGVDLGAEDTSKADEIRQRGEQRAMLEREGVSQSDIMNNELLEFGQAYLVDD